MVEVLGQILDRLTSLEGSFKAEMSELRTDVSELKTDVTTLKTDVSGLKTGLSELKTDVSELKTDVSTLKTDFARMDNKLNAVVEQTAGLVEFKTETTKKIDQLISDNITLQQVFGEHEIAIRSMQRRFFNG